MSKKLAFGGKGLDIVGGSRVRRKTDNLDTGTVASITFKRFIPAKYQVKWDSGLTTWVKRKEIRPC